MITVIHPSRGRAKKAYDTYCNFINNSEGLVIYKVSIEPDQYMDYLDYFESDYLIVNENKNAIEAINNAAKQLDFDLLMVVSDDFESEYGWDSKIKKAVDGKYNFLLKTYDGLQKWIVTLPIMDRKYYDSFGYVYYPEYKHLFSDTELTTVAEFTDRLIIRNDIIFKQKAINDSQHKDTDSTWMQGEYLYLSRFKINFGVDKVKEISDLNHLKWLYRKLR